jgi:hypothetical protein
MSDDHQFYFHKGNLERYIQEGEQTLVNERPFLTAEEIEADTRQIASYKQELKEMLQMEPKKWLETHHPYEDIHQQYQEGNAAWRNNYREELKLWCTASRAGVERRYRVERGMYAKDPNRKWHKCTRCQRLFEQLINKQCYIMASFVSYDFEPNIWRVSPSYGSIIADNYEFVVVDTIKMGSLLRQGIVFCDFCLVDLVENGALRPVFIEDVIVDQKLFEQFRGKGPRAKWLMGW